MHELAVFNSRNDTPVRPHIKETTFNPSFNPFTGFLSLLVSGTKSRLFVSTASLTLLQHTSLNAWIPMFQPDLSAHQPILRFWLYHVSPPQPKIFFFHCTNNFEQSTTQLVPFWFNILPESLKNLSFHPLASSIPPSLFSSWTNDEWCACAWLLVSNCCFFLNAYNYACVSVKRKSLPVGEIGALYKSTYFYYY